MDKQKVAGCLRRHLERRLSTALSCEPQDFKIMRLGSLIHLAFLVHGDQESISGFSSCFRAVVDLIGAEIVWADTDVEDEKPKMAKDVVN